MPVTLPRKSDVDMHREDFRAATERPTRPSLNAEECTAHQDSKLAGYDRSDGVKKERWDGRDAGKLPN